MASTRSSYMPAKQAAQVLWSQNFHTVTSGKTNQYGLTADQVAAFATVNTTLQAAWAAVMEPSTRTKPTVAAKDDALRAMKAVARNLVSVVQGTPSVTNQLKLDAGLTVRSDKPTPTPIPAAAPKVNVIGVFGRTLMIELRNVAGDKRAKPEGVKDAMLFYAVGPIPPVDVSEWTFIANPTRTNLEIVLPGDIAPGATVWLTAYWQNSKSDGGPASAPLSVTFGGAGVIKQAA